MKNKSIILVLIVLVGTTAILLGFNQKKPLAAQHETLAQAESEARQNTHLAACLDLQTQNEPNETDAKAISDVVAAKLTDRPKTTAYGLDYKSFNSTDATGTIIYDGTSGNTFNFAVNHTSGSATWKLIKFEACQ